MSEVYKQYLDQQNAVVVSSLLDCSPFLKNYFGIEDGEIWIYNSDLHALFDCASFKYLYFNIIEKLDHIKSIKLVISKKCIEGDHIYWGRMSYHLGLLSEMRSRIKFIILDDAKAEIKYTETPKERVEHFVSNECFTFYTRKDDDINPLNKEAIIVQRAFVPMEYDLSAKDLRIVLVASDQTVRQSPLHIYMAEDIREYFQNIFLKIDKKKWTNLYEVAKARAKKTNDHYKDCTANDYEKIINIVNNRWYKPIESSDTVVVFVHGMQSNSAKGWYNQEKDIFWPELVCRDPVFKCPSVYLGGYYTEKDSRKYCIDDCSAELLSSLENSSLNNAPLNKNNILFVCHSLGGVVVRHLLVNNYEKFVNKKVGLVLLASPSLGSTLAIRVQRMIAWLSKNKIKKALTWKNDELVQLHHSFKELIGSRNDNEKTSNLNISGCEGYENEPTKIWRYWCKVFLVTHESAVQYYFGESWAKYIPRTNHFSIAKPDSIEHPSHQFLSSFWVNSFQKNKAGKSK